MCLAEMETCRSVKYKQDLKDFTHKKNIKHLSNFLYCLYIKMIIFRYIGLIKIHYYNLFHLFLLLLEM